MVRIRYVIESEGRLVSKPITSSVGAFRTVIERSVSGEVFHYTVTKQESTGHWAVRSGGESRNLTVAKNKVKLLLRAEGVSFLSEVRRKSKES